jgi:hypothetical protein
LTNALNRGEDSKELDELVATQPAFGDSAVDLHCTGGFVVTMLYGFERTTNDLGIIEVAPSDLIGPILKLADSESALAAKPNRPQMSPKPRRR